MRISTNFLALGRRENGSALVEFAASVGLLLTVVFGILDVSLAIYSDLYASEAASSATRYAIVRGSTAGTTDCSSTAWATCVATSTDISNYVKDLGLPLIQTSAVSVSTQWLTSTGTECATCNSPGDQVKVTVRYSYPFVMPFVSLGNLNLTGSSQMVIQQ